MIQNKKILITGAAGSIGSELVRQLADFNEITCLDIDETALFDLIEELKYDGKRVWGYVADIRDLNLIKLIIEQNKPGIIFHAAARKHVTPMEQNPDEAISTNVIGTLNLLKSTQEDTKFIFISTDKAVNPTSVMGATKRLAEIIVKNSGGIVVRFANVLGSQGSVISIWQKQVDAGKPLTITDPRMERYFMSIPNAVSLVIKAAETVDNGDTVILDMGKPIKILDLAQKIIEESKKDIPIKEIGIRPGESLSETLMYEHEKINAVKKENLWIIK